MRFPLIALLLLCLFACKQKPNTDNREEAKPLTNSLPDPDSVRLEYEKKLAAKEDLLPVKQVLEVGKLNPVDEAPSDTAFFLFREHLLEAVQQKDIFFILEIVDEQIKCSFGEGEGLPAFVRIWQLDSPTKTQTSALWPVLKKILIGGGTFNNNRSSFLAPYTFSTFPDQYDGFEYGAITGRGVRLREGPGLNTRTIRSISYEILKIVSQTPEPETINGATHHWIQVELLDGTKGYVFGQFIANPLDFRAGFTKQNNGEWKMDLLIAGD